MQPAATASDPSASAWAAGRPAVAAPPPPSCKYSRETMLGLYRADYPLPPHAASTLGAFALEVRDPLAFVALNEHEKKYIYMQKFNFNERQLLTMANINSETRHTPKKGLSEAKTRTNQRDKQDVRSSREEVWDTPSSLGTFGAGGVFGAGEPKIITTVSNPFNALSDSAAVDPLEFSKGISHTSPSREFSKNTAPSFTSKPAQSSQPLFNPTPIQSLRDDTTFVSNPMSQPSYISTAAQSLRDDFSSPMPPISLLGDNRLAQKAPGRPIRDDFTSPARALEEFKSFGRNTDPVFGAPARSSPGVGRIDPFGGRIANDFNAPSGRITSDFNAPSGRVVSDFNMSSGRMASDFNAPSGRHMSDFNAPTNNHIFNFIPPKWLYKDPDGQIQGPFASEQMHGWYKDAYFPTSLPIKCEQDVEFIPLYLFVNRYGTDSPFMSSLIEQENLERNIFIDNQKNRQHPARGFAPIGNGLSYDAFRGAQPHKIAPYGTYPEPAPQRQLSVQEQQYMLQQQRIHESAIQTPTDELKRTGSPSKSAGETEKISPISSRGPISPKEKALQPTVPKTQLASPAVKSLVAKPVIKETITPQEQVVHPIAVDPKSKPVPHSWATSQKSDSLTSMSLKEIQAAELQVSETLKKQQEEHNAKQIILEAAHIAKQQSTANASIIPAQSTWATKSNASDQKKSLAQIIEDEKRTSESKRAHFQSAAGKRYADTIAVTGRPQQTASPVTGTPKAHVVVASGPVYKPVDATANISKSNTDGWNVVGKTATVTKNSTTNQVSSISSIDPHGASEALINWCRNYLRDVQREGTLDGTQILTPVDFFITMLLSFKKDSTTIENVCYDSLGGVHSIDSRKFAEGFIKRRRADMQGGPSSWSSMDNVSSSSLARDSKKDSDGWQPVTGALSSRSNLSNVGSGELNTFVTENKFAVVNQKGNAKKKKNKK